MNIIIILYEYKNVIKDKKAVVVEDNDRISKNVAIIIIIVKIVV